MTIGSFVLLNVAFLAPTVMAIILFMIFFKKLRRGAKPITIILFVDAIISCLLFLLFSLLWVSGIGLVYAFWIAIVVGADADLASLIIIILLLAFRRRKDEPVSQPKNNKKPDYIVEIQALKELLDSGAITQEEYDAKKKQLLE